MMEVGLVNQGTMAAMGRRNERIKWRYGMEGGDMGLAAMSGGMVGMGEMNLNAEMNPEMAKAWGLQEAQRSKIRRYNGWRTRGT